MKKIIQITKKNFKVLLANKFSYFLLFLFPLFIISITALLYHNQTELNFSIGTISTQENNLYEQYYNKLKEDKFITNKFNSKQDCIENIKQGTIYACIIFPENFQIKGENQNNIELILDNSRSNIVQTLENSILSSLNAKTLELEFQEIQKLFNLVETINQNLETQKQTGTVISKTIQLLEDNNKQILKLSDDLNKELDIDKLNLDDLGETKDNLETQIKELSSRVDEYRKTSEDELDDLTSEINNLNATSSEKKSLKDKIKLIENELEKIKEQTNSLKNSKNLKTITENINHIETTSKTIKTNMENIKKEISQKIEESNKLYSLITDKSVDTANISTQMISQISNLNIKDAKTLASPVNVKKENIKIDDNSKLTSLIPSIIAILITTLSIFFAANLSFKDKNSKANIRNILTKASSFSFITSNFITIITIIFIQIGIITSIYSHFFLKNSPIETLQILITILLLTIPFTAIGLLIGNFVKSENSYILTSLGTIFVLFSASGKLLPIELLKNEKLLFIIKNLNPHLLSESILRKLFIFSTPISNYTQEIIYLSIITIVIIFLIWIFESFQRRRFVYLILTEIRLKLQKKKIK